VGEFVKVETKVILYPQLTHEQFAVINPKPPELTTPYLDHKGIEFNICTFSPLGPLEMMSTGCQTISEKIHESNGVYHDTSINIFVQMDVVTGVCIIISGNRLVDRGRAHI